MPNKIHISKNTIEQLIEENLSTKQIAAQLSVCSDLIRKYLREYNLETHVPPMKHSEETKKLLSEKRLKYLKENPDKHVWKRNSKFKSKPCEKVKQFLLDQGILFIPEYSPLVENRYFSIDIAIPDKMIGIEINGNQHYEKNGELKPYYRERENILQRNGWTIYQVHYSACFNLEKWIDFLDKIKNSLIKVNFDYFNYSPKEKKLQKNLCECGELKCITSIRCKNCVDNDIKYVRQTIPIEERVIVCSCGNPKHYLSNRCISCHNKSKSKNRHDLCFCGNLKTSKSQQCRNCNNHSAKINNRKIIRPSKEELEKLIWEKPFLQLSKDFGVSDVAIKKWCKFYGITNFPGRGYWRKVECGLFN